MRIHQVILRGVSGAHGPLVFALQMLRADGASFPAQIQLVEAPGDGGARGLWVVVTDDGSGIGAADLPKLFDPFYSQKGVGRGMGLAVALGIARAHGGGFTVESEPGQGSRFRLYLPLDEAELDRHPDATRSPPNPPDGSILLVEDEPEVREIVSAMVLHLDYEVIAVSGGREAIERLETRPEGIRLVLCDLTMPEMDGWETLTALRALVPGLPVILTSGYGESQAMSGTHSERIQCFLGKPFKLEALRSAIASALEDEWTRSGATDEPDRARTAFASARRLGCAGPRAHEARSQPQVPRLREAVQQRSL